MAIRIQFISFCCHLKALPRCFSSLKTLVLPFYRTSGQDCCCLRCKHGFIFPKELWGTAATCGFEGQQSPKPLVSMVMCQSQIHLLMRLAGDPKRYLVKSWEQISVPGAEKELSFETHRGRNVTEAVDRNTSGHLQCSLPAPQKV